MSALLVQSCSKSKNHPTEPVPALELYSGFFFKIIKKAMREDAFDERIDICILSAEYGLIDADAEVEWYDRRMDVERARELAPEVRETLCEKVQGSHERVIVNVGGVYNDALEGVDEYISSDIFHISGSGIGEKGRVLKRVIRGGSRDALVNGQFSEQ
jgi:hypothetical protein